MYLVPITALYTGRAVNCPPAPQRKRSPSDRLSSAATKPSGAWASMNWWFCCFFSYWCYCGSSAALDLPLVGLMSLTIRCKYKCTHLCKYLASFKSLQVMMPDIQINVLFYVKTFIWDLNLRIQRKMFAKFEVYKIIKWTIHQLILLR